jgi:hypothetical protein
MTKAKAKAKAKPDDLAQSKRFIETARELGGDETPEAFERVFKKIVSAKRTSRSPD